MAIDPSHQPHFHNTLYLAAMLSATMALPEAVYSRS